MSAIRGACLLVLWAVCCFGPSPAFAEKRVALLIGNSNYEHVVKLANPANDSGLLAETLRAAGFDTVDARRDLKIADMRRALRDFGDKARDADIAVVYYAGHGIEVDGVNYVIPVDAVLERDTDVYDEALSLERILAAIEPAKQLRLVILDACRDNPFANTMKRTIASRSIGRGLAKVEPTSPNTLIAFASKAGSTASDGDASNSPFTTALAKQIARPGLDLRKAFGYVRDDVLKATGNRQEPYVYGSLGGDDLSLVPAAPAASGPQADPESAVRHDYELALQLGTRDGWGVFLSQYPDGFYANLAKAQLKKIAAEEARAAAEEKARLAEQERARLASDRAHKTELEKAVAAAKSAEEARIAAEKAKQVEQDRADAAERSRAEAESAAKAAADRAQGDQKVAALSPPADKSDQSSSAFDLPRALQAELRRVGCNTGAVDGNWDAASQRAMDLFNKHAGLQLNAKVASADALDVVKSRTGRICPLICEHGYKADGETCVKIACDSGYHLSDDNKCERDREHAPRDIGRKERKEAAPVASAPAAGGGAAMRAKLSGNYRQCMGPLPGCYDRALKSMGAEMARVWCTRKPTC
jgi:uncharacterized caspase-like protein